MATATVYPTGYTDTNNLFTDETNAYSDNGSYMTCAPAYGATNCTVLFSFPSAEIPEEAVITTVTLQTQWKTSNYFAGNSSNTQIGYTGEGLRGTFSADVATGNTDRTHNNTTTGTWTAAELNSENAYAAINYTRSNFFTGGTCSCDYVCIIVAYNIPTAYTKALTATVTATVTARKKAGKILTATTNIAAAFVNALIAAGTAYTKALTATVAAAVSVIKQGKKVSAATTTVTASLSKKAAKAVAANTTATVATAKKATKTLTALTSVTGLIGKLAKKILTAVTKAVVTVRQPRDKIQYILLSYDERTKILTNELRVHALSYSERQKDLSLQERVQDLTIQERQKDLEVTL